MDNNESLQSKVISFLRFPLIVGIVLFHSYLEYIAGLGIPQQGIPVYRFLSFFLSVVLGWMAVPLFFFISGYLFFYRTDFSVGVYKAKLCSRIRTLLIPYLFWNAIVLVGHWGMILFSPMDLHSGVYKLVCDYTFCDYLAAFWDINGEPINGVLWFIRDLMVVVLFSPFVYVMLRYLRWPVLVLLGGMWVLGIEIQSLNSIPNMCAIFFFSLGAWFSIEKRNFVADFKPFFPYGFIVYLLLAMGVVAMRDSQNFEYIYRVSILIGGVVAISLVTHYVEKGCWKTSAFLTGSYFIVYAFHALPLVVLQRILFRLIHPTQDWQFVLLYLLVPSFIIGMDLLIYALLNKCFPRFTAVITGSRNRKVNKNCEILHRQDK